MSPRLLRLCLAVLVPIGASAQERQGARESDPLREHYQAAQTYQLGGDLDRAEREYLAEVLPRALQRLAAVASADGRHAEARRLVEQAIQLRPGQADLLVDRAILLLRERDVAGAASQASEAAATFRDDGRAARVLGRVLLLQGKAREARDEIERAMKLQADFETAFLLALASLEVDRRSEAQVLFDDMIARQASADLDVLIGRAYLEAGLHDEAGRHFASATKRDPAHPRAHYYRALASLGQGDGDQKAAREALQRAIEIDPAHEPSRRLLADLDAGKKPGPAAGDSVLWDDPPPTDPERNVRVRAQIAEVLANAYYNLAVIYTKREDFPRAASAAREASHWKPDLDGVDRALGLTLFYADRFDEAITPLERHLASHPEDAAARRLLDTSYLMVGRPTPSSPGPAAATATAAPLASLDEIESLVESGRMLDAEKALWATLDRRPGDVDALTLLGRILIAGGRAAEAEAIFGRALDAGSRDAAAYAGLAEAHRMLGRPAKERELLESGLAAAPDDPDLAAPLARNLFEAGDFAAALTALGRVPESDRPPESLAVEIGARLGLGERDRARTLLKPAAGRVDAAGGVAIVDHLLRAGLAREARDFVETVRVRVTPSAELLSAAARASRAAGDREAAGPLFEEALELDPQSREAMRGLGEWMAARGDLVRATQLLDGARTRGDESPELLRLLATTAGRALRLEEALAAARRLAEIQRGSPDALNLLGVTELQAENWSAADETFARLVETDPSKTVGHLGRGIAQFGLRDYAGARAAFERCLELDPRHAEARYHLGVLAREEGDHAAAIQQFERAIQLDADHEPAHTALGGLFVLGGSYDRARQVLERAVELNPSAPQPHYQLGLLYTRLGDPERARREMDLFLKLRGSADSPDRAVRP